MPEIGITETPVRKIRRNCNPLKTAGVDIRVGTIKEVTLLTDLSSPAMKLAIDLGKLGVMNAVCPQTSDPTVNLREAQVLCLVNTPSRSIGGHRSDVLVLGCMAGSAAVLATLQGSAPEGTEIR